MDTHTPELQDAAKAVLRGKFTGMNVSIKKEEKYQINVNANNNSMKKLKIILIFL